MMKKIILTLLVLGVLVFFEDNQEVITDLLIQENGEEQTIRSLFQSQQSGVQVEGVGEVVRVLADDNEGSRHQRFILALTHGQTLLISHNIDLAPRIEALSKYDKVSFYGEYEWSSQGGVVHWTHHDPRGNHINGWLEHDGRSYQ